MAHEEISREGETVYYRRNGQIMEMAGSGDIPGTGQVNPTEEAWA